MKKNIGWLVVLLTAVWAIISWHWYTCKIKGFCGQKIETQEVKKEVKVTKKKIILNADVPKTKEFVIPAKKECKIYLTKKIKQGARNDAKEVLKLEKFFNNYQKISMVEDGYYSKEEEAIIKKFQQKFASEILAPWDLKYPTGNVYSMTIKKINELYCQNI